MKNQPQKEIDPSYKKDYESPKQNKINPDKDIKSSRKKKEAWEEHIDRLSLASSPKDVEDVINTVSSGIEDVMKDNDKKSFILNVIDLIDDSKIMSTVREEWAKVPSFVKFGILHSQGLNVPFMIPKAMMRCGLLPYHPDKKDNDEFLANQAQIENKIITWSLKAGALFMKDIKMAALSYPIAKLLDAEESLYGTIRKHLIKKHEIRDAFENQKHLAHQQQAETKAKAVRQPAEKRPKKNNFITFEN